MAFSAALLARYAYAPPPVFAAIDPMREDIITTLGLSVELAASRRFGNRHLTRLKVPQVLISKVFIIVVWFMTFIVSAALTSPGCDFTISGTRPRTPAQWMIRCIGVDGGTLELKVGEVMSTWLKARFVVGNCVLGKGQMSRAMMCGGEGKDA